MLQSLPLVYSSLEENQAEDEFCKDLKRKIETNPAAVNNFHIHKKLVRYSSRRDKCRRWVVPTILRAMLLSYFDDSAMAGHLRTFKTFRRIAANFGWPHMRTEIFRYVRRCVSCQRAKAGAKTRVGLHAAELSKHPLRKIFVDFVSPLTGTKRGNAAILVDVHAFSKFVIFFPVRKITSQVVIDCLERAYFPTHGAPTALLTDNATVFRSKLIKGLCFRWEVSHIYTTPYYPQASLAERVNRKLKVELKIFHHKSQNNWDELLPLLAMAFNTATHESSKFSPDVLFLGRELKCPLKSRWDFTTVNDVDRSPTNSYFWSQAYDNLRAA